jgi:hypothetical protein
MTVGSGSSAKILRFSYDASGNAVAVDFQPITVQRSTPTITFAMHRMTL